MWFVGIWILAGIAAVTLGCAQPGKTEGSKMDDQLEKLVSGYSDLYQSFTENRKLELEDKVADFDWLGLYLAAPGKLEASSVNIPVLAISRRTDLREWEVDSKANSFLAVSDLGRGAFAVRPLYSPPAKKMKAEARVKGRKPEPDEGFLTEANRALIGGIPDGNLAGGEYAIVLIQWDQVSNRRRVQKPENPSQGNTKSAARVWPYAQWADLNPFREGAESPKVSDQTGITVKVREGIAGQSIHGAFSIHARPIHPISRGPQLPAPPGIQAGVRVELLLMTLDGVPKVAHLDIPILGTSPIRPGEAMRGWFNLPLPFEPAESERMLYVFADDVLSGPVRVPGSLP